MDGNRILLVDRNARTFTAGPERTRTLVALATVHRLMDGQRLDIEVPGDLVVRQGSLRLSETLTDGRSVTRAVLQTGMLCRAMDEAPDGTMDYRPRFAAERCRLHALGEAEVWVLPPGTVQDH